VVKNLKLTEMKIVGLLTPLASILFLNVKGPIHKNSDNGHLAKLLYFRGNYRGARSFSQVFLKTILCENLKNELLGISTESDLSYPDLFFCFASPFLNLSQFRAYFIPSILLIIFSNKDNRAALSG
jgi:hypothetical protein